MQLNAHISGGHYAIQSISARSSLTVRLFASYDNKEIKITRAHCANFENNANLIFDFGGSVISRIAPYRNIDVNIPPIDVLTITNEGNKTVNIMFADNKMSGVVNDVYASLTADGVESRWQIVNNFELNELADVSNEGLEDEINYTIIGGAKLSANAKFGDRALYYSDTSGNDSSGLLINKSDFFDMANDFTISFWIYGIPGSDRVILRIGDDNVVANSFMIRHNSATDSGAQFSFRNFGVEVNAIAHNLSASAYKHFAISKVGTTLRMFVDGTQIGTNYTVSDTSKLDNFYLGYAGLNNASYKNFGGYIDGFSYNDSIGLYTTNFTPPASAPV